VRHLRLLVVLMGVGLLAATAAVIPFAPLPPILAAQQAEEYAQPSRHFRVPNPARLSDAEALGIYERIVDEMVAAYRLSRDPVAPRFVTWRRYNRVPYRSAAHGERFVNNYANGLARGYGPSLDGPMPPGAIFAKDSFTVTARGDVFSGPLFLMEKMPPGSSPETRDWRYTMIMPDGSLFGITGGEGDERMTFCATCHEGAGRDMDDLFFVPEPYRLRFLEMGPLDPMFAP
jgi:hypothetical protein